MRGQLGERAGLDEVAVAQDGHAVTDPVELVDPVADVAADPGVREKLGRHRVHPGAVDQAASGRLAAEVDVGGDAAQGDEVDLLVDRRDARALGLDGPAPRHRRTPVSQLAAVEPVDPGQDLDQGRLAGAVLADEGVHLSGAQGEGDLVEDAGADELLGAGDQLEDGCGRRGGWAGRSDIDGAHVIVPFRIRGPGVVPGTTATTRSPPEAGGRAGSVRTRCRPWRPHSTRRTGRR